MRNRILLVLIGVVTAVVSLADDRREDLAFQHLKVAFFWEMAAEVTRQLGDTGFVPDELDKISSRLTADIADCTLQALKKLPSGQSDILIAKLSAGSSLDEVNDKLRALADEEAKSMLGPEADGGPYPFAMSSHLRPCAQDVFQKFGMRMP